jgi:Transposase IS66 family/IS66 C-terminal element
LGYSGLRWSRDRALLDEPLIPTRRDAGEVLEEDVGRLPARTHPLLPQDFNDACRSEPCVAQSARHLTREPLVPGEVQAARFGREVRPGGQQLVEVSEGSELLARDRGQRLDAATAEGTVFRLPCEARVSEVIGEEFAPPDREARPDRFGCGTQRRIRQHVSQFVQRDQVNEAIDLLFSERARLAAIVLPKSPVGDGLRYLTNQWTALQRFVEDGRLAIDNNRAENQLRIVALGRKNWLFAGSFEGARRAALLYSLVQSCKLIDVSPFAYLKDVLVRVATHPQRLIHQLTPNGWAATFGSRPAA